MTRFIPKPALVSLILTFTLLIAGCGGTKAGAGASAAPGSGDSPVQLTVSAAASLTDALQDIRKAYESKHASVRIRYNFGGSGALQKQIEQGAPADLFLSASVKNMKALADQQLVDEPHRTTLLTNELVVVIPADAKTAVSSFADLDRAGIRHIAIGIPESVPAGSYAKEALVNAKQWDTLQAKAVQAKDVRQVLQYVETGNADAGFVYRTDALTSQKTRIAFAVDAGLYTPVEYPAAVLKASEHRKEAEDFYAFLQSKEAMDVFISYGFSTPKRQP